MAESWRDPSPFLEVGASIYSVDFETRFSPVWNKKGELKRPRFVGVRDRSRQGIDV